MSTFNSPVQLSNIFKPKIWGRRELAPLFTAPDPTDGAGGRFANQRIGEVWVTDDVSRFLNGPAAGMTLAEASEKYGPELHGKSWPGRRFPLLAKYIYTSDWLSVQVHPDDAYAAFHDPGNLGKCEMWYFVSTDLDATILLGLKPGVKKEQLLSVFKDGTSRDYLQSFRPQPMYLEERCLHCGDCLALCPEHAIEDVDGAMRSRPDLCLRCGVCVEACQAAAREIAGRRMGLAELMAEIEKDVVFFDQSGGGVTLSGGEPVSQHRFAAGLLGACRDRGIHTVLETCGYAHREPFLKLALMADLVLFDLKTLDREKHKRYTGVRNDQILRNLEALARSGRPPVVRIRLRQVEKGDFSLAVEDEGIGFSAVNNDVIFEPFRRLHAREAFPGSGIGLAICRTIASRHGWILTATSTPAVGSTFKIIFPKNSLPIGDAAKA